MGTACSEKVCWLCSDGASQPVNVHLEMTFPIKDGKQSYKPKFEAAGEKENLPASVDQQAAAGI